MLTRWALLLIGFVMAAPAAAEEMSLAQARRFIIGKLFEVSCFEGTRAVGRIYSDGSVIGTIQFRGTGPERSASLPAGTLKVKGEAVCASLRGMPFEPCFKLNRTSEHSFRGSVLGFDIAYCDFNRRFGRRDRLARADDRRPMVLCGYTRALLALKSNAECPTLGGGAPLPAAGGSKPPIQHAQRSLILCEMHHTYPP